MAALIAQMGLGWVADVMAPAAFSISGGMLRTSRVVPARFRVDGGNVETVKDTPLTTAAVAPKIEVFTRAEGATQRQQIVQQRNRDAILKAFEAVNARLDEVALLARLGAVEELAQVAHSAAQAAKVEVDGVRVATQATFADIDSTYERSFNERTEVIEVIEP